MASGRLQTLCYKYEIERNLRTTDYAGFQLLGLNDYSGQGTALEGVLNVHWGEKGYTTAREFSEFCRPIVPLARFPKFVYANSDTLRVPVEVYNAMYGHLRGVRTSYYLYNDSGKVVSGALLASGDIPLAKHTPVGEIVYPLDSIQAPQKLTLAVCVGGSAVRNHWTFWVYPDSVAMPAAGQVLIADSLDARALAALQRGGTVLLTAAGRVRFGNDVIQHYLPVEFFGGEEALSQRRDLDGVKKELCTANSVQLVEWPYSVDPTDKNVRKMLCEGA
jgi:hypothetical protein